jgi:NAD(P)-dependent dehydrogenase (short-subunit alcohol dehydrogenase family)
VSDAKDLSGRVVVITGANTGIGRATAEALARRGARVWLACRSEEKTRPVLEAIRAGGGDARFLALDLADLASVRRAAEVFLASGDALTVLLNNAGLGGHQGVTKDGFEIQFGTNHLGHFLLTALLMPRLEASAPARIVNVSSRGHFRAKGIDFDAIRRPTATLTGRPEYSTSKLANVLFTKELARRLDASKITAYAVHPGVVASEAWRRIPQPFRWLVTLPMVSNEEGAETSIFCATAPEVANETGLYYDRCRAKTPNPVAEDAALARRLWEESERCVGLA